MSKSTEEIKADIETGVDQIKELCSMVPITPEENLSRQIILAIGMLTSIQLLQVKAINTLTETLEESLKDD